MWYWPWTSQNIPVNLSAIGTRTFAARPIISDSSREPAELLTEFIFGVSQTRGRDLPDVGPQKLGLSLDFSVHEPYAPQSHGTASVAGEEQALAIVGPANDGVLARADDCGNFAARVGGNHEDVAMVCVIADGKIVSEVLSVRREDERRRAAPVDRFQNAKSAVGNRDHPDLSRLITPLNFYRDRLPIRRPVSRRNPLDIRVVEQSSRLGNPVSFHINQPELVAVASSIRVNQLFAISREAGVAVRGLPDFGAWEIIVGRVRQTAIRVQY